MMAIKPLFFRDDENDSLYRLMALLTLYGRFYQEMTMMITAAAERISHANTSHLAEVRTTYAKQTTQNQELIEDLRIIYDSVEAGARSSRRSRNS
jgi:hypothetical protein